ncbi:hypothetical protein [Methylophilus medardicus]|uniref:Uncharacterized protein n=1 Tax=Methylophilus medardicus TaxID=2588534 RepID=A0A5B8CV34_9PROT|nr:hypothetical protein [Methylophilus medardicus]QDC44765.1 hypothetical protein FIU01_09690 [Methylophilus medardicus]QDC49772.1 hypothetical protein FIU00_09690 [Methylophilus medardicus]QDC53477.1 hypothetical protein FIT99_09690 [Methylophilus medardicus]
MESAIIGLLGVIIGALITVFKDYYFQKKKDEKDAKYLATLVSFELERYASACADVVGDDGLCEGQPDANGFNSVQVPVPKFEPLLIKGEWTALPQDIMYEVLDLPHKAEAANDKIRSVCEFDVPPDFSDCFEERQFQYANLGINALMLADKLKTHAGFPKRADVRWTPMQYLVEQLSAIEKARFEAAQRVRVIPTPSAPVPLETQSKS